MPAGVTPDVMRQLNDVVDMMIRTGNASIARDKMNAEMQAMEMRLNKKGAKVVDEFNKTIKEASTDAEKGIKNLGKQSELSARMVQQSLDGVGSLDVATRALSKQLNVGLNNLGISFDQYGKQIETLEDILEFKDGVKALETLVEAQLKYAQNAEDGAEALLQAQNDILKSDLPDYFKELAKDADQLGENLTENIVTLGRLTAMQGRAADATDTFSTRIQHAGAELGSSIKNRVSDFFSLGTAMTFFTKGMYKAYDGLKAQIEFGSLIDPVTFKMKAFSAAIDENALAQVMNTGRQLSNSMGGPDGLINVIEQDIDAMRKITGSREGAAQALVAGMESLSRRGIGGMVSRGKDLEQMFTRMKAIGVSTSETIGMMDEVTNTSHIQTQLLTAATEQERKAIVMSAMARMAERKAIGMSTEQAMQAAKSLGMIQGQDVRKRFKQAARLQMTMGMMGIAGGAEAANVVRKGRRATTDERKQVSAAVAAIGESVAAGRTGSIGQEIVSERLLDGLGAMGQFADPDKNPFITTLIKNRQVQGESDAERLKTLDKMAAGLTAESPIAKGILELEKWLKRIDSSIGSIGLGLGSKLGSFIPGAIGGALAMKGGGLVKAIGGAVASKFTGKAAGGAVASKFTGKAAGGIAGATTSLGAAPPVVAKGPGIFSKMGSAFSGVGAKLTGGAAKAGLKSIPIVGALAGVGFGLWRAAQGDWTGAALEVASGTAGMFPGAGTAASLAISGGLVARDVAKDGVTPSATLANQQEQQRAELAKATEVKPKRMTTEEATINMLASSADMSEFLEKLVNINKQMLALQSDHFNKVLVVEGEKIQEARTYRRIDGIGNRTLATATS